MLPIKGGVRETGTTILVTIEWINLDVVSIFSSNARYNVSESKLNDPSEVQVNIQYQMIYYYRILDLHQLSKWRWFFIQIILDHPVSMFQ